MFYAVFFKLLNHLLVSQKLEQNVILEEPCPFDSVRERHNSDTVLDSLNPSAFKVTAVCPGYHSISMFIVMHIPTDIVTS